jgi:hypothetical protein
MVVCLLTAML